MAKMAEAAAQMAEAGLTLEAAKSLRHGEELHYAGRYPCSVTVGPRGGRTVRVTRVRVSGAVKTWKRTPGRVYVPVKYGLYESGYITESNLRDWHKPGECPAGA